MKHEGQFSFLDLITKAEVVWCTKAPFIPIQLCTAQWSKPEKHAAISASQGVVCDIKAAYTPSFSVDWKNAYSFLAVCMCLLSFLNASSLKGMTSASG